MMSSTIASKPPVSPAASADGPSATATTSMPSAVRPRATAVRIPGSSSTTSTRATGGTLLPHRRAHLRTLSDPMGQAGAMRSQSRSAGGAAARRVAVGVAVAGAVGLGLLAIPAGAGAAPELPPVTPEDLVSSVLSAEPGAFGGTVELDNALGLPALPNLPQTANGTSSARIWSDGQGRGRIQLPTSAGERTLVSDGTTFWSWNSEDATVTKAPADAKDKDHTQGLADPTAAATQALQALRSTSDVRVDGTAEVAGRAAYELVLTPAASERTLL